MQQRPLHVGDASQPDELERRLRAIKPNPANAHMVARLARSLIVRRHESGGGALQRQARAMPVSQRNEDCAPLKTKPGGARSGWPAVEPTSSDTHASEHINFARSRGALYRLTVTRPPAARGPHRACTTGMRRKEVWRGAAESSPSWTIGRLFLDTFARSGRALHCTVSRFPGLPTASSTGMGRKEV